ncbi:MAG: hypothetical protein PHF74_03585 [Dehalococcoidales bacterium]|nr:hypothetical protein [Dehalococcoidales bacterium]
MNNEIFNFVLKWIKTHRFWTSVIILWTLHLALSFVPLNLLDMGGVLEFILSSQFLGYYTFIGGITWSFRCKKVGYTLMTIGVVSSLMAFNILIKFYVYHVAGLEPYYLPSNYIMLSIFLICGALFIYFGNLRYRQMAYSPNESKKR